MNPLFPTRRSYAGLAVLAACFVLYGSLVPLDFVALSMDDAWWKLSASFQLETSGISKSDFLVNIALLVPFGFFVMGALTLDGDRSPGLLLVALLVGGALSFGAELSQVFFPDRTPSMSDVIAQSLGHATGIALWCAVGPLASEWIRDLLRERRRHRQATRLLGLYVAASVVAQLVPMDFTVRPAELLEKYREGRIVILPSIPSEPSLMLLRDWLLDVVRQVPIGMLAILGWTHDRRRSIAAAVWIGLSVVAGLEMVQVLVWSRYAETMDLLTGGLGVTLGAIGTAVVCDRTASPPSRTRLQPVTLLSTAGWIICMALYHWSPFDFVWDAAIARSRLPEMWSVPLTGYYHQAAVDAQADLTTKLVFPLVLGILLRLAVPVDRRRSPMWTTACYASTLLVLIVLEVGQLFLATRHPDLADVVLGTVMFGLAFRVTGTLLNSSTRSGSGAPVYSTRALHPLGERTGSAQGQMKEDLFPHFRSRSDFMARPQRTTRDQPSAATEKGAVRLSNGDRRS